MSLAKLTWVIHDMRPITGQHEFNRRAKAVSSVTKLNEKGLGYGGTWRNRHIGKESAHLGNIPYPPLPRQHDVACFANDVAHINASVTAPPVIKSGYVRLSTGRS